MASYRERSSNGTWYDLMQVCLNGHMITEYGKSHPENLKKFCPSCGIETITNCPGCNAEIPGKKHIPGVFAIGSKMLPPEFCSSCGTKFLWTTQKKKSVSEKENHLEKILKILHRFHFVAKQLRERHADRYTLEVEDEYDVQDLLHALLKIEFDDIRPEEWTPSYAGKASRMDFLLKNEKIVIETKKTRKGLGSKEASDQIIIDIARYKEHSDCNLLICFIYDPEGRITNPVGLKNDLEKQSSENLKIIIEIITS